MRCKKLKLSAVFLIGIGLTGLQAQEVIPTTGGNASGNGGTSSYTVGQVVCSTYTGSNGSVAQGVQQAYEIAVVNGIGDTKGINLKCKVYPNPISDFLWLNIENYNNTNLSYQLFDMSGKLLENRKIIGNETTIAMTNRVAAIYFLKVIDNQREIKTFKIIKIKK